MEAIPENAILAYADEADIDGDGISGKPNYVWDVVAQRYTLGRFGWKANQPTLLQQVAAAYNDDMGITTSLFFVENSAGQSQLTEHGVTPEVSDEILEVVTFYVQTLAVPAATQRGRSTGVNRASNFLPKHSAPVVTFRR